MGPVCADSTALSPRGVKEDVAYRVKNTFVEIGPMPKDEFSYCRARRSRSEANTELLKVPSPQLAPTRAPTANGPNSPRENSKEASFVPDTPSPVMRPAPVDGAEVPPLNEGYGMGEDEMCLPPAYMDEEAMMMAGMGYDGQDMAYYGVPTIMYDPISGCGWPMCMPIDMSQAHMGEDMGQCDMVTMDGQVLMDAGDGAAPGEVDAMWAQDPSAMETLCCNMEGDSAMMSEETMNWAMPEPQEEGQQDWATEVQARVAEPQESTESKEWGDKQAAEGPSSWEESRNCRYSRKSWRDSDGWEDHRQKDDSANSWDNWDYGWRKGARGSRRSQRQAESWNDDWSRWHREERSEPVPTLQEEAPQEATAEEPQAEGSTTASSSSDSPGAQAVPGDSGYTTVMLRNIPNKYTREMLVKQLNQDFKGRFDFVYLPIDFKNKCNVGYGFINFRTSAACDEFIAKYDGVDVRKCLPGLNSKKVAGVTPARVQGLEENVRRLRTGPVMNELVNHPEWMPLLLDENGEASPFPMPDHPAPATKLKRRAREDVGAGRGGW